MKLSLRGLAFTASLLLSVPALAADLPSIKDAPDMPQTPDWIVTIGGTMGIQPSYPGARSYSFMGMPTLEFRREDQPPRFGSPDDDFSFVVLHNDWLAVGPAANYVNSRSVRDNPALYGMNGVDASIELGAFAEWTPLSFLRIRGEVRKAVTGYDGMAYALDGDLWKRFGQLTLSIGPRLNFNNDQYANSFFSVTPWQAALNQSAGGLLTPYRATGGLTSAGFTAAARYEVNEFWRVSVFGNYEVLTGSVADSPIAIHAGSRDQFTAGVEIAYHYRTGALSFLPTF
ncbi:MipA/OmpV family protein [Rhodoblastus sp.]|uniref:MipA/OmpV family protein n=1 Tax=Rhodoblastus sp. TaxID=1962975 RepID=UPI003F98E0FC